jgi:ribosomal protein S18 acetylase RimI-like enzyme
MIRRATFADIPAMRVAFARLLAETDAGGPGYPVHDVRALDKFTLMCAQRLETDAALLAYVALDDATGALLGMLIGEIAERVIGTPSIFGAAHWLYVDPAARGRGVARALVRAGVADCRAAGVPTVELAARAGDEQWAARGWMPFLVHYAMPLDAVGAAAAERVLAPVAEAPAPLEAPAAPPPAAAATNGAPAAPPRPRRPRRGPTRRRRRRAARPATPGLPGVPSCS